jgi:hypothetical protein
MISMLDGTFVLYPGLVSLFFFLSFSPFNEEVEDLELPMLFLFMKERN